MTYILEIVLFVLAFCIVQWEEKKKRGKRRVYIAFVASLVVFVFLQYLNFTGDMKKDWTIEGLNRNIETLHEEIRGLSSTIDQQSAMLEQLRSLLLAALPEDVIRKAEALYHKAIINMEKGDKLESAKAFQELSILALGAKSYNTAAIASLLAANRYEEAKVPLEAAELKSKAGDIYLKLDQVGEAKLWKREALKIYSEQGQSKQVQMLRQEIQLLDQRK